ncbi:DUF3450 domain-containing protein [Salinibacter ruber]|uniref:DUF3450 domain-containing protein n=1 Tax=Salinibacter ruber TaxID=146919 RepID=UPI0021698D6B|nr:DUF3450 domain-containing protein [Salinibacter ruber]MCS3697191.1 nucleoside 2-deoxyribosyltransferase [Salinibacter ruber]
MSEDESEGSTEGQAEPEESQECFVIAPIGPPRSDTRDRTEGLLDEALRPVVKEFGLDVTAPYEIAEAGSIPKQVIQHLLEAELVIADLTDLNPNVMYELAVRHAKGKPVVPIADRNTSLPFDITTQRTIFYEDSMHGLSQLKPTLKNAVDEALSDDSPDNPIYNVQQDFRMREAVAGNDAMEYLLDRIDDIEASVSRDGDAPNEERVDDLEQRLSQLTKERERLDSEVKHLKDRLEKRNQELHRTEEQLERLRDEKESSD